MRLRTLRLVAAASGMALGSAAYAAEPAKLPAVKAASAAKTTTVNQQLADSIAAKLTSSGAAHLADVSVQVTDGVVTLMGSCKDAGTKSKIIQDVRMVNGVSKVRDGLTVSAVQAVRGDGPPMTLPPGTTMPNSSAMPAPSYSQGPMMSPPMTSMPPSANYGPGPVVEPQAMGTPGMGSGDLGAPPLPPNAWPTYAPHNNLSRVAYPQAYPYNAFPFIGPYYPFPKVPLGWRKVTLEWEDGHWWYGRNQTPNDYWRVRFW